MLSNTFAEDRTVWTDIFLEKISHFGFLMSQIKVMQTYFWTLFKSKYLIGGLIPILLTNLEEKGFF